MSVELSPKYDWMLRYCGEIARLLHYMPTNEDAEAAYDDFGADHTPEECAWEEMVDGAR